MMRKVLSLTITLLAATLCYAALPKANHAVFADFTYNGVEKKGMSSWRNPILPGWYSDPSACRTGDDYWLVTSTFGYFPGVPLFHSRDLVNWELVRHILDRPSQLPHLNGQSIDRGGIYAPDISYNPHNKTYYMITTDVGKGHFYVTAKDPRGEWSDPVWLPQIGGIDPSFFFDDDGKAYIVHKEDTEGKPKWSNNRAIRIIRFDTKTGQTYGEDVPFREEGVGPEEQLARDEGPHIYKINGKYYMICAEGGTSWAHSEVCYRADSIFGPYTRWARNPMLTQRLLKPNPNYGVTCTGHVSMVQRQEGDWWVVFLGCRPWAGGTEQLGRETFLMPVRWSKDGFPYITMTRDTIPLNPSVNGAAHKKRATRFVSNFSHKQLGSEWMSLRGEVSGMKFVSYPIKTAERRTECLLLPCSDKLSAGTDTPSYLGRRIQHHEFTAETEMFFTPRDSSEAAGLLIFKNEKHQYFLCRTAEGIELRKIHGVEKCDTIARTELPRYVDRVYLKAECKGTTYAFYYRTEGSGTDDWTLVADGVDAGFVSSRVGGFTGTTIGMYAERR